MTLATLVQSLNFTLNGDVFHSASVLDFHSEILSKLLTIDVTDPNFGFSKLRIRVRCTRR